MKVIIDDQLLTTEQARKKMTNVDYGKEEHKQIVYRPTDDEWWKPKKKKEKRPKF